MEILENPKKGLSLLVLTTEEVIILHRLLSQLNKKSAIQKMEGYIHLVKIVNNMEEVLNKTNLDYTTISPPTREVQKV